MYKIKSIQSDESSDFWLINKIRLHYAVLGSTFLRCNVFPIMKMLLTLKGFPLLNQQTELTLVAIYFN